MGILLALTVVCAVLARCGAFGTGETLEDLAKKQELAAAENPESAVSGDDLSAGEDTAQPDSSSLPGDGSAVSPQNQETPPEPSLPDPPGNTTDQPERETGYPQEDIIMEDRVTYQEGFYYESLNDAIKEKITGISYPEDDSNAAAKHYLR